MISVLMSVFNETENEIRCAIDSVIRQTYPDWELIVVVDNPQYAEAIRVLKDYAQADNRIKYAVNDKNIGLALSMNVAASLAAGDYYARMDADDICIESRFEIQKKIMDDQGYDVVCGNYDFIDEAGNEIKGATVVLSEMQIVKMLPYKNIIHHPTVMMKASSFHEIGGYRNFICAQDYDLWLRMLKRSMRFYMADEKVLHYRIREKSITKQKRLIQACTLDYIRSVYRESRTKNNDHYSYEEYLNYLGKRNAFSETAQNDYFKNFDRFMQGWMLVKNKKVIRGGYELISVALFSRNYRPHLLDRIKIEYYSKH